MKIFLLVLREIHTFAASLIIKIKKYETVYNEPNDLWGGIIFMLISYNNSSLKFEIMAKQLYVASQRVL